MRLRINTTIAFLFVFCSTFGQNLVNIYGLVKDAKTSEPLIGVNIILEGTDKGTTTDLDGKYILENVAPGSYNISASYLGYTTNTRTNVIIQSKGNDDINFDLIEGGVQFETIEVTANPFQNSIESPLSLQRLSPEEIKTYPGGNNDIAKVVQSLPGVSGSIGGFRNDVIIRGGAPNENVYYLDGIEIPNINHFSTQGSAGGPVGLLNVDFIEGVELSSSAFGAKYDNVLSGVLQFDQKNGNTRERQTNIRLGASETALTTEGPILKRGKETSNTSYIVSVRRSYLQFLFELIGLPIRPDYWDYQYKINHKIDQRNTIFITGIGSIDDFSVKAPDEFDFEQQAVLDQVPIIKQWTSTAGIGWKRLLKDGKGVMNTNVSINVLNNNFSAFQDNQNQTGLYLQNLSRETEQRARYSYTRFIEDWSLTGGGNITRAIYDNESIDLIRDNSFTTNLSFLRYGFFGQASKTFLNGRLDFSTGFRMDDNSFSNENLTILKTFSPRISASYVLDNSNKWRVNASLGKYYKIAPYTILGFQDQTGNFANRNNSYIGSLHSVVGIEYRLGNLGKISIEGFYKKYDSYPISVVDGISLANKGGDFSVLGNELVSPTGEGITKGIEFLFQQKLYKNFYGILAYTLFSSEFTNAEGAFLPSVWDSRHLISFTGGYKAPKNWEFSVRYRFAGNTPFAPVNLDESLNTYPAFILDYDNLGSQTLAVFNQLDIRIDKKWNFQRFALNVFLEFQNALGSSIPSPPQYGLDRDETGTIEQPRALVLIPPSASATIPTIGLAIDF